MRSSENRQLSVLLVFAILSVSAVSSHAQQVSEEVRGQILIEDTNCVACHKSDSGLAQRSKKAPRLAGVTSRLNPWYIQKFIASPQSVKHGTSMPNVMSELSAEQREQAALELVHFLGSTNSGRPFNRQAIDTVAAEFGREVFHTVGCVACHSPRDNEGQEAMADSSVPLGALDDKYSVQSLAEFLRRPHGIRPSGRMPDMRLQHGESERIANYLLSKTQVDGQLRYTMYRGNVWEGIDENLEKVRSKLTRDFKLESIQPKIGHNSAVVFEGFLFVDRIGEYSFHFEMNGGILKINDKIVLDEAPSNRRGVKKFSATANLMKGPNQIEFTYFHTGRDPKLVFEMQGDGFARQAIRDDMLTLTKEPIPILPLLSVDAELAKKGRERFVKLGCANCHDDLKVQATPATEFANLNGTEGCLSGKSGAWPVFSFSNAQRSMIMAALSGAESADLNDQQHIGKTLTQLRCIACHERDGVGGIAADRNHLFTGTKKELGNQGRIPPPLTLVGAKLQKEWLAEVLMRGGRQRSYLGTRMPQFGDANVSHLVDRFGKVDHLEPVKFDAIQNKSAVKSAGHRLMGKNGFSCIACHDFNGQKAAGPGAMDIIQSTSRLKKDWFYQFMLAPNRFAPGTVMPTAWPNGYVFKKDILGGDLKKQIESLWVYLEDGRKAKNPDGLSRQASEIRVTDVAEIARGRGVAGYRGIAVGYPAGLNLAFNSEQMSLRQIWKGDFVNVDHGRFSPRGSDRIEFPEGIPFHRLESLDNSWPYKRKTDYLFPQDHGYQFRGYRLDKLRRPTLMYEFGEVRVEEFFEVRQNDDGSSYLVRTITFNATAEQPMFYFRAAAGKSVKGQGGAYTIDRLSLRFDSGGAKPVIREGEPVELLVPIQLPKGETVMRFDYEW